MPAVVFPLTFVAPLHRGASNSPVAHRRPSRSAVPGSQLPQRPPTSFRLRRPLPHLDAMAGLTASLRFGTPSPKPPEASRSPSGGATGSPAGAGGKGRAQPQQVGRGAVSHWAHFSNLQLLIAVELLH
jgi:hypothetical protein